MTWYSIAKTGEFEGRPLKVVMLEGRPVMISKLDGKYYAVDAICTHYPGYLPDGVFETGCVTCPVHHAQFDLRTGKMLKNVPGLVKVALGGAGAKDLNSYELKVEGDEIMVNK